MVNVVKVYSNDQMEDMGMHQYWQSNFHYAFSNLSKIELERAARVIVQKVGYGHDATFGIKVNQKSLRIWFDGKNPTAERIARASVEKLMNVVKQQWMENGRFKTFIGELDLSNI